MDETQSATVTDSPNKENETSQYSCTNCGACCCGQDPPNYFDEWVGPLSVEDFLRLPEAWQAKVVCTEEEGQPPHYSLPIVRDEEGTGRCEALSGVVGEQVSCTIYEHRPNACRSFLPGDYSCRVTRILHGIDPIPMSAVLRRMQQKRAQAEVG